MRRVLTATAAELLKLQPLRHGLAVFGLRIVPLFAITALQRNDLSGHCSLPVSKLCLCGDSRLGCPCGAKLRCLLAYCTISLMAPAPTACPPSRIQKPNPLALST